MLRCLVHPTAIHVFPTFDGDAVVVCLDMGVANGDVGGGVDVDAVAAWDVVLGADADAIDGEVVGEKDVEAPEGLVEDVHATDLSAITMVEADCPGPVGKADFLFLPLQALGIDEALAADAATIVMAEIEQGGTAFQHGALPSGVDNGVERGVGDTDES